MRSEIYKLNFIKKVKFLLMAVLLILLLKRDINLNRVKANCKDNINNKNKEDKHSSKCNIIMDEHKKSKFTMPIIIAKKQFDVFVDSYIDFNDDALEVKEIKNDIILTDEKLINRGSHGTLFLSGEIKTKIEYVVFDSASDKGLLFSSKYLITSFPFNKAVNIDYFKLPEVSRRCSHICEYSPEIKCNLIRADFYSNVSSTANNSKKQKLNAMKSLKLKINSNVQIDLTQLQNVNM
ncbi:MAG: hypothetical protein K0R54_1237 [Clostridiaceae bacterium]|nr:hypothetical protein [Clostridiaceae bacterium]